MKRLYNSSQEQNTDTSLVTLDGYIVNLGAITKNSNNANNHYSFLLSMIDQTTIRITKFL
ncbi:unnamed protein product, partial [Rotaria sp. Silwood2]